MFLLSVMGTCASAQSIANQKSSNVADINVRYDPAAKVIHIAYPDVNEIYHIEVNWRIGHTVYSSDNVRGPMNISVTDWNPGIYFVTVKNTNGSCIARITKK